MGGEGRVGGIVMRVSLVIPVTLCTYVLSKASGPYNVYVRVV